MTTSATASEQLVREFWRLMASNDFFSVGVLLTDDFVLEWPQSDERIRGRDRFALMNADYPSNGRWFFVVNRIVGGESEAVSDVSITDGVQNARAISFFSIVGGKIARLVEYWPEPTPAPENRKHLTEKIVGLFPILLLASALLVSAAPAHADEGPPAWAFPINPPGFKPPADDGPGGPENARLAGRALASTGGNGKTIACGGCHGADLRGLGAIPGIAGRSPSYVVRQLYDFKHGARAGVTSAPMLPTVANLGMDDMISLAAYAASLAP